MATKSNKHPILHAVVYGVPGTYKSTFAATFPIPIYVAHFDSYGKDAPYMRMGDDVVDDETEAGVPIKRVMLKGKPIIELHYYHDPDPEKPDSWELFRREQKEFDARAWGTWVLDSMTAAVLAAKYQQMFKINPGSSGFAALGGATDQLEMQLLRRVASFDCNVVVICHVAEKYITVPSMQKGVPERKVDKRVEYEENEEGQTIVLRGLSAPGRLARDKGLISQFSECYRSFISRNKKGEKEWWLQTDSDEDWVCASQIPAPNPCVPAYDALWEKGDR